MAQMAGLKELIKLRRAKKKANKKIRFRKINVFVGALLVFITAFILVTLFSGLLFRGNEEKITPAPLKGQRINLLITGLDRDNLRTDFLMIASLDTASKKVDILSVPGNTRMYVGGRYQKISAAHAIKKDGKEKGISGTIEALNRLTAIPLNYYIEFPQGVFEEFIDNLGGVDFYVPERMKYKDALGGISINLKKGEQFLDGKNALDLVRFASYDDGVKMRTVTQENFCKALIEQKLNPDHIKDFPKLSKMLDVKTNLKPNDIIKYSNMLLELNISDFTFHTLPGNEKKGSVTYWIPDIDLLKDIIKDIFEYDPKNITTDKAN